jgi:hypothetical protein
MPFPPKVPVSPPVVRVVRERGGAEPPPTARIARRVGGGAGAVGGGGAESEDTVTLPSIHIPNTYGPT